MEMMDEMSPSEQEIASDLTAPAADPSPASRASIMYGVYAARRAAAPRTRWHLSWRL